MNLEKKANHQKMHNKQSNRPIGLDSRRSRLLLALYFNSSVRQDICVIESKDIPPYSKLIYGEQDSKIPELYEEANSSIFSAHQLSKYRVNCKEYNELREIPHEYRNFIEEYSLKHKSEKYNFVFFSTPVSDKRRRRHNLIIFSLFFLVCLVYFGLIHGKI